MNRFRLFTQTQTADQLAVSIGLGTAQVRQQAAAGAHHFQQAAAAVVVFRVGFEVWGQIVDAEGQQCNLHFRRTGIAFFALEIFNDLCFLFDGQCHDKTPKNKYEPCGSDKFAKPEPVQTPESACIRQAGA